MLYKLKEMCYNYPVNFLRSSEAKGDMKMKGSIVRAAALTLLSAAVLVVGAIILSQNDDAENVDTIVTFPSEYAYISETESETEAHGGHDLEIYVDTDELNTETVSAELEEETDYTEAEGEDEAAETTVTSVSRTIITSRQRKEYDSNSVYIDMENILQLPELPVGCEITTLTILLRYYGFDAEKTDLASNYLPKSWGNARYEDGKTYKDSFFYYFIGDPFSTGYGCFSYAIETAANSYISSHGGGYTVKNISGCSPDTLYEYLIVGTPVLCWGTDGMIEPEYYETWYDNATGEQLDWYLNEHCFVLAGFNMSAGTVTLNDPMKGIIDYNIDKFETRFQQMYSQAIVIIPDSASEDSYKEETSAYVDETEYIDSDLTETSYDISDDTWETGSESEIYDTEEMTETWTSIANLETSAEESSSDELYDTSADFTE